MPRKPPSAAPDEEAAARTGRPLWSGTVSFGLVTIPVHLLPGVRHHRIALRTLDPEGTPLNRQYVCSAEDLPLEADDIVRGYEVEPGRFVVIEDEELATIAPDKSRDIDVRQFVALREIDPIFYDRPYFLTPAEGSTKAYRLLVQTMERAERAAIATFVMRGREYLVAISAADGLLRLETLRFSDEVRSADSLGLPAVQAAAAADLRAVQREMRAIYADAAATADLVDDRDRALLEMITAKDRSDQDVVTADAAPTPGDAVVIDLMERLKQSLEGPKAAARRPKRRSRAA